MDDVRKFSDEDIDVVSSPIVTREASSGALIPLPTSVVRETELQARQRIGVEIVIQMDPIDVVSFDHIENDLDGMVPGIGLTRIEPLIRPHRLDEMRGFLGDMVVGGGAFSLHAGAERIEPGMQFQAAGMSFAHGELQGIPRWMGGLALSACEKLRPRLVGRFIERVASGADLEEDRVEMESLGRIEQRSEFGLLLGGGKPGTAGPVDILDRGYPGGAELPGDGGGRVKLGRDPGWRLTVSRTRPEQHGPEAVDPEE